MPIVLLFTETSIRICVPIQSLNIDEIPKSKIATSILVLNLMHIEEPHHIMSPITQLITYQLTHSFQKYIHVYKTTKFLVVHNRTKQYSIIMLPVAKIVIM